MKRFSYLLLVNAMLVILGVFALSIPTVLSQDVCGTFALTTGQEIPVGNVSVSNDAENLYVTIETIDGWFLQEVRLFVGTEVADVPANGVPDSTESATFPVEVLRTSYTFVVEMTWAEGDELVIVPYALVFMIDDEGDVIEGDTAAWGGDQQQGEDTDLWFYLTYEVGHCEPPKNIPGGDGCSLGFWKNHTELWESFIDETIDTWFTNTPEEYADYTLLEALSFQGGPGVDGATEILLKQAVAALLNAWFTDFGMGQASVNMDVNDALASEDRDIIIELAEELDDLNNGNCVFSSDVDDNDNNNDDGASNGNNGNNGEEKVTICHIPPGNPSAARQITIGASAVPAHLNHGDVEGECPAPDPNQSQPGNRNGGDRGGGKRNGG